MTALALLQDLLSQLSLYLVLDPVKDRVKCKLSGHEMPARVDAVRSYAAGKKFVKLRAVEDERRALAEYEPHIVPSAHFPGQVFCRVTGCYVARREEAILRHSGGARFTLGVESIAARRGRLLDEPDPRAAAAAVQQATAAAQDGAVAKAAAARDRQQLRAASIAAAEAEAALLAAGIDPPDDGVGSLGEEENSEEGEGDEDDDEEEEEQAMEASGGGPVEALTGGSGRPLAVPRGSGARRAAQAVVTAVTGDESVSAAGAVLSDDEPDFWVPPGADGDDDDALPPSRGAEGTKAKSKTKTKAKTAPAGDGAERPVKGKLTQTEGTGGKAAPVHVGGGAARGAGRAAKLHGAIKVVPAPAKAGAEGTKRAAPPAVHPAKKRVKRVT